GVPGGISPAPLGSDRTGAANRHRRTADRPACVAEATSARRRPGPQQHSWWKGSGMLQTTSTERRAAGEDRPRSGESLKMRPTCERRAGPAHSGGREPGHGRVSDYSAAGTLFDKLATRCGVKIQKLDL